MSLPLIQQGIIIRLAHAFSVIADSFALDSQLMDWVCSLPHRGHGHLLLQRLECKPPPMSPSLREGTHMHFRSRKHSLCFLHPCSTRTGHVTIRRLFLAPYSRSTRLLSRKSVSPRLQVCYLITHMTPRIAVDTPRAIRFERLEQPDPEPRCKRKCCRDKRKGTDTSYVDGRIDRALCLLLGSLRHRLL